MISRFLDTFDLEFLTVSARVQVLIPVPAPVVAEDKLPLLAVVCLLS